jgi:hypothetical protein
MAYDLGRDLVVLVGLSQTWVFDGTSWRSDPRPGGPSARSRAGVAYDLVRGRTILFGGSPNIISAAGDTWEYAPGPVARWTPLGAGCAGTVGTPVLRPSGTSLPITGTTFVLELTALPATGVAAFAVGLSAASWSGNPLPMDLGVFGMPNCSLYVSLDALVFVPVVNGRATLSWSLPNSANLIGAYFWNQALVVDPGVNPAGAVVANAGAGLVGPF